MVVNAHGRALCRHSKPGYRQRVGRYTTRCTTWCEWRTVTYTMIIPGAILIALLWFLAPHGMMAGLR
jgi:hypothetical protein